MTEREQPAYTWVELTDELLRAEHERWLQLVDSFEPLHDAGEEMTAWLRDCVAQGAAERETWACVGERLFGFYSVAQAEMEFSKRAFPILAVRRMVPGRRHVRTGPQSGMMLAAIARDGEETHPGFGRTLFLHALGRALSNPENVAIFVRPANAEVARLWLEAYSFKTMDRPAP
jgi:hypothetical protein